MNIRTIKLKIVDNLIAGKPALTDIEAGPNDPIVNSALTSLRKVGTIERGPTGEFKLLNREPPK